MKKRNIALGIATTLTVVIASTAYVSFARPFGNTNQLTENEQAYLSEHLSEIGDKLYFDFELSSAADPIYQGDRFPRLNLPQISGPTVNWNAASVVTLGNSQIGSPLALYEMIKDISVQKIHIISVGSFTEEDLSRFPADVAIFTSVTEEQAPNVISQVLYENLGVYVQTSGYLLDNDGTVLYARINHGGFTGLAGAVRQFSEGGAQAVTPSQEAPMRAGKLLLTDDVDLPSDVKAAVDEELSKGTTVVMFSYEDACAVCASWLSGADEAIESWRSQGYGVLIVEAGNDQNAFAAETLGNGALLVQDKANGESGELFEAWGVNVYPAFYILKDGAFQGQVAYSETEAFGNIYRNVPFEIVSEAAQASY